MLPYLLSLFFALHPQDGPHAEVDLTVEDRQIALVVTANLAWLDELMDIPRELPDNLHPSETGTAVEALQDFSSPRLGREARAAAGARGGGAMRGPVQRRRIRRGTFVYST